MSTGEKHFFCSEHELEIMLKYVQEKISSAGIIDEKARHLQIAAEEALSNVVRHSGLCSNDQISVHCEIDPSNFQITISDKGTSFNPLTAPKMGLGLILLLHLVRVKYERIDDRNVLTICIPKL